MFVSLPIQFALCQVIQVVGCLRLPAVFQLQSRGDRKPIYEVENICKVDGTRQQSRRLMAEKQSTQLVMPGSRTKSADGGPLAFNFVRESLCPSMRLGKLIVRPSILIWKGYSVVGLGGKCGFHFLESNR